ncbi:DNA polymerase III subunit alpha [Candidatus Endobugula sertula]|uniref:DNA polymerase III subunit alpha n=1 Tax=Candidatus Endobugula sertula TaxID=62101 RepID=A0A1D2QSX2_9GAMM|nr:DNA polymerase III subunit alpha [Candidatus Endobugula sertula]
MSTSFVHLRLHTEFSLVDSTVRIKPLINRVAEQGMPAIAVTDLCNFYGLIKFYTAAQGAGIKPIVGADFWVRGATDEDKPTLISLLAMNHTGYRNIIVLISRAFQEGQYQGEPFVQRRWISEHSEGIIALSGGQHGDIGIALLSNHQDEARRYLRQWQQDFPSRFYMELQRTGRENEEEYLHSAVSLAAEQKIPVVATNDVRFLTADDFEAHESRVCIGEGRTLDDPRRERRYSEQQYLRSPEEMRELFSDIPQALANTVEIAKRCTVDIELGHYYLPDYPIPEDFINDPFFKQYIPYENLSERARQAMEGKWSGRTDTPEYTQMLETNVFFQKVSYEGMEERLLAILDASAPDYKKRKQPYMERLRFELDIIMQMGFPGYFLIVMDFIQWAKDHDIPVGPGRGSGAGSLVAYAQKITDLDPLEYDLLFERFLNPERVSMPDFDIDFCMDKRDQVINYVAETYGRDAVSQIITFGTMAAKAVVRDVARVQGKSYGLADKLSKLIPMDVGMTLQKAFDQEDGLREFLEQDEDAQEIWEMSMRLEGVTRNVGKHAGGVVISPTKLIDFSPLFCDETGKGLVTQYDKNDVEAAGLVKFDFLGLRTLTIIDWAVKMVNRQRKQANEALLDIAFIPLDDQVTFQMLKTAETTAVFQLESRGMKDLIKRLQPDNIEDLTALVALFRPGPLQSGMVDDFINRKHGRAEVAYPDAKYQHEKLKPILEPTYGVIVYQEQVMQIAQELAGYTLGGADMLRRAMGKKKPEEMAKQRAVFEAGAKNQGIDPELAIKIFDLVEKFAGYGFNKSHSAAYAVVSYQTAWLKTHYPAQFMAATMSSDMDKTDKVVTFIEECRSMKLTLLPPDVNQSDFRFTVDKDNQIIYGLGAIKGLGEGPVDNIIEARKSGPFTDLFDFCARIDARKVNKRALEALVRSGSFDTIGPDADNRNRDLDKTRSILFAALGEAVKTAEQQQANANAGIVDLFVDTLPGQGKDNEAPYLNFHNTRRWSVKERLNGENDTLGLYLTGHPIDEYEEEVKHFVSARISDLVADKNIIKIAGLVIAMRIMKTKRGDTMGFITLDDRTGRMEVAVFTDTYHEYRDKLVKGTLLVVEGQVSHDDYNGGLKMRADKIIPLEQARQEQLRSINIHWESRQLISGCIQQLKDILSHYRLPENSNKGGCQVMIDYERSDAKAKLLLSHQWRVQPVDELILRLKDAFGDNKLTLGYES